MIVPAIGFGLNLAGIGLSAYGQYQGAKAMEREAARQAAEQEALAREWYERYQTLLSRLSPLTAPAATQSNLAPLLRVVSAAQEGSGMPTQSMALASADWERRANAVGNRAEAQAAADTLDEAALAKDETHRKMADAAALYAIRKQKAAMKGSDWRIFGSLLSGIGNPLMAAGFMKEQQDIMKERQARWEAERKAEQQKLDMQNRIIMRRLDEIYGLYPDDTDTI